MRLLEVRGHKVRFEAPWRTLSGDPVVLWGDGECIAIDPRTGERLGASDAGNNGKAVGY